MTLSGVGVVVELLENTQGSQFSKFGTISQYLNRKNTIFTSVTLLCKLKKSTNHSASTDLMPW
jgi:hypothetical protein